MSSNSSEYEKKELKKLNVKSNEEKDPTKMTKEEFFAKIDEARKGEKIRMSRDEMRKMLMDDKYEK